MLGFLFLFVIDWVMRQTVEGEKTGIRWNFTTVLEDLDFADDIALLSSTLNHLQSKTNKQRRTALASASFRRPNYIWQATDISRKTKASLFKSLVLSVLLYGGETWKLTKGEEEKLDIF